MLPTFWNIFDGYNKISSCKNSLASISESLQVPIKYFWADIFYQDTFFINYTYFILQWVKYSCSISSFYSMFFPVISLCLLDNCRKRNIYIACCFLLTVVKKTIVVSLSNYSMIKLMVNPHIWAVLKLHWINFHYTLKALLLFILIKHNLYENLLIIFLFLTPIIFFWWDFLFAHFQYLCYISIVFLLF